MRPVRLLVVGVGHMGRLHATKVAELAAGSEEVRLAGVADVDAARAAEVAAATGSRAEQDFRALLAEADAAIVSVPTVAHFAVVSACLGAGLHVLVEKPVAATLAEAEKLLCAARDAGKILQVGHLEWFNSAMRAVAGMVRRPRFFEGHRMGPFRGRALDVDVVRDLMIHDIDIVQRLVGAEPERIEAIGVAVLTDEVDIANARLTFPDGAVANLTASRVSASPMRKLRFFQPDGYFSVDFIAQSVTVFRRTLDPASREASIEHEELSIDREDALASQLQAFLAAVGGREATAVTADEALRALRTAHRVIDAMPPQGGLR